ncbi:hypothetical protein HETIRDRAFT_48824 [Heterobasidion irregulare TC 32-1]|uniref:Uncharacterized protein n=1 Tax=Heterobasidion irregulare (strain TC 32-1) TaxID=747525 RepID=W4K1X1_HETIT|nr:uncharacterized protein HETIRDRAFT_48824 [Heterobasidion irregulare TC 32-1]ETW79803.1 hypothetical protein HETIRDRAFT_48824 [Heterobasidion irregulare TC 32-1]
MRKTRDSAVNPAWFPWPNKVVCVLDILRNLPRSLLSDTQMEIITWGMMNLGIDDLPSISSLKDTFGGLQQRYGIRTTRREGALGHVYYTNSLADQICQEFSNPRVVSHLCAYPEDAGNKLEQAWQADRWLKEIEPALTTPMIRAHGHDFYIFEPTKLNDGRIVLPTRWFFRTKHENGKAVRHFFGQACKLEPVVTDQGPSGYIAVEHETLEIDARDLLFPFPRLVDTFHLDHLPDPRVMLGLCTVKEAGQGVLPWTHTQDPSLGNDWRVKSKGHRVEAMMMWLYCDDTSGNLSKKWNKHNSFLWTPAGLPRDMAQKQYNVHFLATSNIAPPLEMLDGVAADLEAAQRDGIWAWDVAAQELVLVFPIVLALLGDNPMQSEFACHIGLRGKFFCRACWVKGRDADDENGTVPQRTIIPDMSPVPRIGMMSGQLLPPKKRKARGLETLQQLADRARRFLAPTAMRNGEDTQRKLRSIFKTVQRVGGMSQAAKLHTAYGVKDTYQDSFIDRIATLTRKLTGSMASRQKKVDDLVATFPMDTLSPVWRIKGLDPHLDTPVEILHVVLLGFVKYFWRDAIARQNTDQKAVLIARLCSLNVSGLGSSKLVGQTLVQYSGSLTGRDFRVIAQVAPFVLYDLVPRECFDAWLALSQLVPLVWQPSIQNLEQHLVELNHRIKHFLLCTVKWTPRWFNKPKFHIIQHLAFHIRRFGPAILFATESFESFNGVIRDHSVHSNRHAPSRDIALGFGHYSRVRHLMSGGVVLSREPGESVQGSRHSRGGLSPPVNHRGLGMDPRVWCMAGPDALALVCTSGVRVNFVARQLGLSDPVHLPDSIPNPHLHQYLTCSSVTGHNGERVEVYSWVLTQKTRSPDSPIRVARVVEILQVYGTSQQLNGCADLILVLFHDVSQLAPTYMLPSLVPQEWGLISAKDLLCPVNVQHNCAMHKCDTSAQIPVRQENELTTTTRRAVCHKGRLDYVLNVGQLHDACHMTSFRVAPPFIDEDTAILTGAAREIDSRKRDDTSTAVLLGHGALRGRARASRSNGTATGLSSDIMQGSLRGSTSTSA